MSLSQPSRTIVVEPIQAATAAAPGEPRVDEPARRVEAGTEPAPQAQAAAGR